MMPANQMQQFITFAHEVADAVGQIHRQYFRQPITTEYKADSSPVTQADQESERCVRDMVMKRFPDHGILGEEYPAHQPDADYVWITDPIDGTKYFMTGHPLFALLLGLAYKGEFVLGIIDQPISGERWTGADGIGSFLNGEKINTRPCPALNKAIIARPGYEWHTEGRDHYIDNIWKASHWAQWGVAPYDYGLLASGHIDLIINAGPLVHDYAALDPIIRNAGGIITDWHGQRLHINSPNHVVACGDKNLLPEIIKHLNFEATTS